MFRRRALLLHPAEASYLALPSPNLSPLTEHPLRMRVLLALSRCEGSAQREPRDLSEPDPRITPLSPKKPHRFKTSPRKPHGTTSFLAPLKRRQPATENKGLSQSQFLPQPLCFHIVSKRYQNKELQTQQNHIVSKNRGVPLFSV